MKPSQSLLLISSVNTTGSIVCFAMLTQFAQYCGLALIAMAVGHFILAVLANKDNQ